MNIIKSFISLIFFISLLIESYSLVGQINCKDCNVTDSLGRKQGLWIEGSIYTYYKDNQRDGIQVNYGSNNFTVTAIGEFSKGDPIGKVYFFDDTGHLQYTVENIGKNTRFTSIRYDSVKVIPKFSGYLKDYFPNGYVEVEGLILFDDDFEQDFDKYGIWKYYDKKGKLIKTEEND
jgi:antitoxin component YwqK of YwqJK toxin-antitoxin module